MWYIYTIWYYVPLKNILREICRQKDGTRKYHCALYNPITNEHTWYVFTDNRILDQKFRIPKSQCTDHMKLKKKKMKSVALLRKGNKIHMRENTESKIGVETEGKPSIDCSTWASIPNTVTKHRHHCCFQNVQADRVLIELSSEMLCQTMTYKEVDADSQPLK